MNAALPPTSRPLAIFLIVLSLHITRSDTIRMPPRSYTYPASTLLHETQSSLRNQSFRTDISFELSYQGKLYKQLWFHTDGVVSFDGAYYRPENGSNNNSATNPQNYMFIAQAKVYGKSILIRSTSSNVTIEYQACSETSSQQCVRWALTYFSQGKDGEVFDIDIQSNTLSSDVGLLKAGFSLLIIDTKSVQILRYKNIALWSLGAMIAVSCAGVGILIIFFFVVAKCRDSSSCSCSSCLHRWKSNQAAAENTPMSNGNLNQDHTQDFPSKQSIKEKGLTIKILQPPQEITLNGVCDICSLASTQVQSNCRHQFHLSCLSDWERKSVRCPNCKQLKCVRYLRCNECSAFSIVVPQGSALPEECDIICCKKAPKIEPA